jgi:SNF2 family DNA or RNA helicase
MLATAKLVDSATSVDAATLFGHTTLVDAATLVDAGPAQVEDQPIPQGYVHLLRRLFDGARIRSERISLVEAAAAVWSRPGFDTLMSGPTLAFEPFDYQLQTVSTVLGRMRGRAILADEVGLGKTIEAALVLSELRLRGLARRVLVITPAGLVDQWREELERKFGLPTTVPRRGEWESSDESPVVVASIATARRDPTKSALLAAPWDLIIVDEAHRLRNPRSASGRFARELTSRYLLLLTATPVENRLSDLYELTSMVAPGLLGTPSDFRRNYGSDAVTPQTRRLPELRRKVSEVTIRHRRSEVALRLPHRLAETTLVEPSPEESELYAAIAARIRSDGSQAPAGRRLTLRSVARLAGSSPMAAAPTLSKLGWTDLADRARSIEDSAKITTLVHRLRPHVEAGRKVLVFTAFRETLAALTAALEREGIPAAVYHGSLNRAAKEAAMAEFRDTSPVLLSTESAGEGRNLQFCHVMINVDLPWNPMQIEQRVGRLHRVGQVNDVLVTNLVARDTIEQQILSVLEAKINLFELVVGELDMILGRVDDEFDFETSVFEAFLAAGDDAEFRRRLEDLGGRLAEARREYIGARGRMDELVGGEQE